MTYSVNALKLLSYASEFENNVFTKIARVIRLHDGKWRVISRTGKNLGTFDTKVQAIKHLGEVEWFKSHKKASEELSYSSIMRELNKSSDEDTIKQFQSSFKDIFDNEVLAGIDNPEKKALEMAMEKINEKKLMQKAASAIDLGDPNAAGKYLADLIRFICRRISPERRAKSLDGLKKKVYYLNEYNIASKKVPPSSALGQSITLLKTLLLEHSPVYIRGVLNSVVRHL